MNSTPSNHSQRHLSAFDVSQSSNDKVDSSRHGTDALIDFIGGTLGGVANVYVGQPLDTVKVKMQTFPHEYRNSLECFVRTFKQDGISRGLYAGTLPSLVANVAENSILFLFYGICQKGIAFITRTKTVKELGIFGNACAGGSAAFFSALALCPTELVKCRLQAMREMATLGNVEGGLESLKKGPWGLTKEILHTEGIRGLFKGLSSTIIREMPGYFVFFGGYELSRELLRKENETKEEIGPVKTMVSGGIGGMSLWIAIFPADVIKSRIQVQCTAGSREPSFMETFWDILRKDGFRALYKGLGPTLVRTFPSTGALFLTYETTKKLGNKFVDHLH